MPAETEGEMIRRAIMDSRWWGHFGPGSLLSDVLSGMAWTSPNASTTAKSGLPDIAALKKMLPPSLPRVFVFRGTYEEFRAELIAAVREALGE